MRVCIYGAGAIGGYLGVSLAQAGCEVSLVARGPQLAAIRENGLTLVKDGARSTVRLKASEDPAELGPQDHVIVALKAHSVPAVAEKMAVLFHDGTSVVTAVNGVPWWYFHGLGGDLEGTRLESVDPGGVQWNVLRPERAIGCVVYPACEIDEPGVITHLDGDRFTLGEPSGEKTDRVSALSEAMRAGGLKAPVRPRIRDEIWVKLWGNLSFNPISALTGATLEQICGDPEARAIARAMMVEGQAVGESLGVKFAIDVDKRIAGAAAVGAHKTSMLQDLERGRAMEIDALVTSVQELGRLTGVPTPTIDAVLGLVKMRGRTAGCY
ncbi:MAG: 2-dehydropantoate 2-reductase [Alphaproteobacteria bacterium]|nr:2-dehydropantoate 2-reductase [Alphaproteobacteria bacterium]